MQASNREQTLLGAPEYAPLRDVLRRRLERGSPLTGRVTLSNLSAPQRDAIDALLGRRPSRGKSLSIDLDALDEQIRASGVAGSLKRAVTAAAGPVPDRRAQSERERSAWNDVFAGAVDLPSGFLSAVRTEGLLKRLATGPGEAAALLAKLGRLSEALPSKGEPLPSLAARLFGDSHSLDPGRPLGTLAVRLARCLAGSCGDENSDTRRSIWARVGVLCDELSQPAPVLNLPSTADHPLGSLLREACAAAEPLHVSLRLLLRYPLSNDATLSGRTIFVCENPGIVALASARIGAACHPLVCINGEAATPAQTLLRQLSDAGAVLRYHGDFDWPGIGIATRIFERFGALPWRFGAPDYECAPKGKRLSGTQRETPWEPALADAMLRHNRAVHEEAVADLLLADLRL